MTTGRINQVFTSTAKPPTTSQPEAGLRTTGNLKSQKLFPNSVVAERTRRLEKRNPMMNHGEEIQWCMNFSPKLPNQ